MNQLDVSFWQLYYKAKVLFNLFYFIFELNKKSV